MNADTPDTQIFERLTETMFREHPIRVPILGTSDTIREITPEEIEEYFYSMAPYALALGIDKAFAHRFGGKQLPGCPWLTTGMDGHLTADEWNQLLRSTVTALDERQLRLPFERFNSK